ncbi:MAG TPA: triose-phosphate isomerase [Clostridiales bacterium]|nr:triose-phosphate isomerase [Clostridiales bacterium]
MKKEIIAGNWKMNNNKEQTLALINELKPLVKDAKCEVVVCVPFTSIETARKALRGSNIKLGAQNVHWAPKGAFTGEISADMLVEQKVKYVLVGHSERRQYFGETNQSVNARAKAALGAGLNVIMCVGETLEERETGKTADVVTKQTLEGLEGIEKDGLKKIVIAYEPVWAIGTGKTATAQDANDTIAIIRKAVKKLYGRNYAKSIRIQYGGSMNPGNVKELMAMPEIDGGLIGGASLRAKDFAAVVLDR